jgi:hypothetical protein
VVESGRCQVKCDLILELKDVPARGVSRPAFWNIEYSGSNETLDLGSGKRVVSFSVQRIGAGA